METRRDFWKNQGKWGDAAPKTKTKTKKIYESKDEPGDNDKDGLTTGPAKSKAVIPKKPGKSGITFRKVVEPGLLLIAAGAAGATIGDMIGHKLQERARKKSDKIRSKKGFPQLDHDRARHYKVKERAERMAKSWAKRQMKRYTKGAATIALGKAAYNKAKKQHRKNVTKWKKGMRPKQHKDVRYR